MTAGVASPFQSPTSTATREQSIQFAILQALLKVGTSTVVQVQAVHGGGLDPVGFVDVLPLVDQVDGLGNAIPHKTIYGRPYVRMQGGANAIILDPAQGDLGLCVFAMRDISSVIASLQHGPPPSNRRWSFADGMYVGGMLNGTPTSYLQWLADGTIKVNSPVEVDITAPVIKLTGGGKVLQISSAGIELDGILWETHSHSPGTYNVSGTPVTGEAGSPKNP